MSTNTIIEGASADQSQPRKRWLHGRRLAAVAAVLAALALAAGLVLGLMGSGSGSGSGAPVTPAAQLSADGYPLTMAMNHQQLLGLLNASGDTSSSDVQMAGSFFTTGAMGQKNGQGEVVLGLTDGGKSLLSNPAMMNEFKAGFGPSGTVRIAGDFLVFDGPMN